MIREINLTDLVQVCAIYNYYIDNTTITFEELQVTLKELQQRVEKVTEAGLPWLVVEENGEILGYAYATKWRERVAYRHSVEVSVYLAEKTRGRGLGTALYKALFERLKQLNIHVVIGGVTLPNPASEALHAKLGMEKVAHFKQVGFKFKQWLDVGYWQKTL